MKRTPFFAVAVIAVALVAVCLPGAGLAAPPANDDFANAVAIPGLPFSDSVDVSEATSEAGEPQCVFPQESKTVWYDYTPASDQVLRLRATGASSTTLAVYTGSSVSSLSSATGCWLFGQPTILNATGGTTYHIRVAVFPFDLGGVLTLDVEEVPPPANDDFGNATVISSVPFSDSVDITAAGIEANEPSPSCGFGPSQKTAWYAFTPSETGSYSVSVPSSAFSSQVAAYQGSALSSLNEIGCRAFGQPLTFHADAGTTYYLQLGSLFGGSGIATIQLSVAPNPVANFSFNPGDPSVFDSVQFFDQSFDPAGAGISSQSWHFGDGSDPANGCCPSHKYAADGDYTVQLDVMTPDGRTAAVQRVVHVQTHDVTIAKVTVPQTASVGHSRTIAVGLTNSRYAETVQVRLLKSVAGGGWQDVGVLTQYVPVRGANRTTNFEFNYTFAPEDAALGKVSFQAIASIQGARDAISADNTFISLPTKVR